CRKSRHLRTSYCDAGRSGENDSHSSALCRDAIDTAVVLPTALKGLRRWADTISMWKCLEQRAKRLVRHVVLAGLVFLPAIAAGATWLTDLPAAQATAKAQGKIVLVDFTGSDW